MASSKAIIGLVEMFLVLSLSTARFCPCYNRQCMSISVCTQIYMGKVHAKHLSVCSGKEKLAKDKYNILMRMHVLHFAGYVYYSYASACIFNSYERFSSLRFQIEAGKKLSVSFLP